MDIAFGWHQGYNNFWLYSSGREMIKGVSSGQKSSKSEQIRLKFLFEAQS